MFDTPNMKKHTVSRFRHIFVYIILPQTPERFETNIKAGFCFL